MKPDSKWWGWGNDAFRLSLAERPGILAYLREKFGVKELVAPKRFDIDAVAVPPSSAPQDLIAELSRCCRVETSAHERIFHAMGKSYRDLLRLRSFKIDRAPDLVLYPSNESEVAACLATCAQRGVAVVPFGGGTSVVGGVESESGKFKFLAALDTSRFDRLLTLDRHSMTASFEAGIFGPELERVLNAEGFTLGHFPQSFEYSTLGGWIAARSSGQNSLRYGAISDMVVSLRVVTPKGIIETLDAPAHACGPDLKQTLIGTEGTCGVIVSAKLKIRAAPEKKDYFMLLFGGFREAAEAARSLVQNGLPLALVRVSDEEETQGMFAMAGLPNFVERYLAFRGFPLEKGVSAVLIGIEGTREANRALRGRVRSSLTKFKYVNLGTKPGEKWLKDRFRLPYLRDELMDNSIFIETLETAAEWSKLPKLYGEVKAAIQSVCEAEGIPCVVHTHISHIYPDGASLYFTIFARKRESDPMRQWRDIKEAANRAISGNRAPMSHHHGIGTDHRDSIHWGPVEKGLVEAVKNELDPVGILNPGKLL